MDRPTQPVVDVRVKLRTVCGVVTDPTRWLERQPGARTPGELRARLDRFLLACDEQRPHRAVDRITPGEAYRATPNVRQGAITLRRAGRLHHLNTGVAHARTRVLAIVDEHEATVVGLDAGEILSSHRIEPDRCHWRNQRRGPGR